MSQKSLLTIFHSNLYMAYALQEFYWERLIFDRAKDHRGEQVPPLSWKKYCYWTDEIGNILDKIKELK